MVKNTAGGTGTKSLARKHQTNSSFTPIPSNEFELVVRVTQNTGNATCIVQDSSKRTFIAHIRNKFRGKNFRMNVISVETILLVGLRDFEKPFKNVDVMFVYSPSQYYLITKYLPNIENRDDSNSGVIFENDAVEEQNIPAELISNPDMTIPILEFDSEFTIDDI
jgi:translation initiation factor IF-1